MTHDSKDELVQAEMPESRLLPRLRYAESLAHLAQAVVLSELLSLLVADSLSMASLSWLIQREQRQSLQLPVRTN